MWRSFILLSTTTSLALARPQDLSRLPPEQPPATTPREFFPRGEDGASLIEPEVIIDPTAVAVLIAEVTTTAAPSEEEPATTAPPEEEPATAAPPEEEPATTAPPEEEPATTEPSGAAPDPEGSEAAAAEEEPLPQDSGVLGSSDETGVQLSGGEEYSDSGDSPPVEGSSDVAESSEESAPPVEDGPSPPAREEGDEDGGDEKVAAQETSTIATTTVPPATTEAAEAASPTARVEAEVEEDDVIESSGETDEQDGAAVEEAAATDAAATGEVSTEAPATEAAATTETDPATDEAPVTVASPTEAAPTGDASQPEPTTPEPGPEPAPTTARPAVTPLREAPPPTDDQHVESSGEAPGEEADDPEAPVTALASPPPPPPAAPSAEDEELSDAELAKHDAAAAEDGKSSKLTVDQPAEPDGEVTPPQPQPLVTLDEVFQTGLHTWLGEASDLSDAMGKTMKSIFLQDRQVEYRLGTHTVDTFVSNMEVSGMDNPKVLEVSCNLDEMSINVTVQFDSIRLVGHFNATGSISGLKRRSVLSLRTPFPRYGSGQIEAVITDTTAACRVELSHSYNDRKLSIELLTCSMTSGSPEVNLTNVRIPKALRKMQFETLFKTAVGRMMSHEMLAEVQPKLDESMYSVITRALNRVTMGDDNDEFSKLAAEAGMWI